MDTEVKTRWTPGPWRNNWWHGQPSHFNKNPLGYTVVAGPTGIVIAQLEGANKEANSRLMAKAPEMADLLLAIVDSCVTDSDTCCVCLKDVDGDHRHSEGCVILLAEALLSTLEKI